MTYAGEGRSRDSLNGLLVANKRKPNFTEEEGLFLISQFERNSGVLTSKLNDASTNKQKVEVWRRICSDYNSRNPIVLRTANDLKRKWKNMVRAAKKELLEVSTRSESGEQSVAPKNLSRVSQRITDILRITVANCGFSAASPGELAGIHDNNDGDSTFFDGGEENGERKINGEQQVVNVVVKPAVKPSIVSPPTNTENAVEDSQQTASMAEPSLSALSSQTLSAEDQKMTHEQVSAGGTSSSQVPSSHGSDNSTVRMSVISSTSEITEIPRVIATSTGGGDRHRLVVPQHKRMLPSPITHALKKRKCSDYADESFGTHVRAEIDKLEKEKLTLEKEKLALEKEKLLIEKEKLALEIQFLRDQMD